MYMTFMISWELRRLHRYLIKKYFLLLLMASRTNECVNRNKILLFYTIQVQSSYWHVKVSTSTLFLVFPNLLHNVAILSRIFWFLFIKGFSYVSKKHTVMFSQIIRLFFCLLQNISSAVVKDAISTRYLNRTCRWILCS